MFRRIIIQLLTLTICIGATAATSSLKKVRFDNYKTNDGLISNRVFALQQDKNGFLWITSDFGLQRFDGKNFKLYDKSGYKNLWRNDIYFAKYDGNNILTVGGYNGFIMDYHIDRDTFIDIMPQELEENNYHMLKGAYTSRKGDRYLFANCGFYKQDKESGKFYPLFDPLPKLKTGIIEAVYQDEMSRYWLASVNELAVYSEKGEFIKRFDVSKDQCGFRTRFMPLKDSRFAVTLQTDEIWIFDGSSAQIGDPEHIKLPFKDIYTLLTDKHGRIWFATDGDGLWYTDDALTNNAHYVQLQPIENNATDIQKIYALTEDKSGGIWFGTQNSGIWHVNPYRKPYFTFSSDYGFPKNVCSSFTEDNNGNLLVSTDGCGIYRFNKDGSFTHHPQVFNNITHLCKSTQGDVYASTWGGGILQINPSNGNGVRIMPSGLSNTSNTLFGIDATSDGEVWACPGNDDLYRRDKNGVWSRVELGYDTLSHWPNRWIISVKEGKNGVRWIITTNSLWRLEGDQKHALVPDLAYVRSHNPLTLNDGVCDREGNFYLASNFGILRYPAQGGEADTLDYVPRQNFLSILVDQNGLLWSAGDMGIVAIDPKKKTCRSLLADNTNLEKSNFYIRSSYVSSNGDIYFGTNGGFYQFNPNKVLETDSLGYFGFSSLYINKQKIAVGQQELAQGALNTLDELVLSYGRTDASICIDLVDFNFLGKSDLSYRLKGLNDEWASVPSDNIVKFNYIPTGSYVLEVKAEKIGEEQIVKTIQLPIRVLPPWWATWWFRLLLLLLVGGIAWMAYRRRVRHLTEQRKELKAKVEEQTQTLRKLIIEKDRIISVIAHDLKSPMFGIVGALENWLGNYRGKDEDHGQTIIEKTYSSANMLQNVLLSLVDWARAKDSEMDYLPTEVDLRLLIENMCKLQQPRANNKGLRLTTDLAYKHCSKSDERMTSTIVRNLISNAIKFSNRGGAITLKGWETHNECVFQIIDQGVGMTKEQIAQFNEHHHLDSTNGTENEKGTGLGLTLCSDYVIRNKGRMEIDSQRGVGTTITIYLPKGTKEVSAPTKHQLESTSLNINNEILQGNTVLVVDDDELICENISSTLQPYMQVITANNSKEALDLLENCSIDIIVSDVEMPGMDGIEFCKEVKNRGLQLPFLFVSARTEDNDRLAGLLSGAVDYIPKPFKSEELLLKLNNILALRQQVQKELLTEKMRNSISTEEEGQKKEEAINPFVEKFINVLEANYSNNMLSVDILAKEMAVSQSTLGRKLKSLVGKTAVDLLTEFRLNKAKLMLREKTEETQIGDIAYKVGFSDPSYFSKKYKEFFGHSPSETNE